MWKLQIWTHTQDTLCCGRRSCNFKITASLITRSLFIISNKDIEAVHCDRQSTGVHDVITINTVAVVTTWQVWSSFRLSPANPACNGVWESVIVFLWLRGNYKLLQELCSGSSQREKPALTRWSIKCELSIKEHQHYLFITCCGSLHVKATAGLK